MPLKLRYTDLLAEFQARRQALWDALALLKPDEWLIPLDDEAANACDLLRARIADDRALAAAAEAVTVGLPDVQAADLPLPSNLDPGDLLDRAVEMAQNLEQQLGALENHQWQRKLQVGRQNATLAELLADSNAAYGQAETDLIHYLGSFERLGKEGLKDWLGSVYNELMDSVAGMTDADIMGPAWRGGWNTYQLIEHVWAWNEQALDLARRWDEPQPGSPLRDLPLYGVHNRHVGKVYDGRDMVALADGIVTVYRKTALLIERAAPDLLCGENALPGGNRGPLCNLIFDVYRHAWQHAQEIRLYRASG